NLTLLGNGVATAGALSNVAGNNAYNGPVTLATDPSAGVFEDGIGAAAGTTLTVNGAVQDPATIPVPAAQLRKLGTGAVVFPNAKTYGGATVVAAGTLRVQNAQSLGVGRSEQQQLEVIGLSGTFSLTFNGSTTSQLQFDVSAANIQAALQSLTSIGGGNVTVTPISLSAGNNKFLVAFSGTLANADQPTITVPPPPSGSAVTGIVTVARDGSKGTTVLSGATLELNGGISLTGEPLTISGPGFNNQGALLGSGGSNTISAVSTVNAAGAVVPIPVTLAASSSAGTTLAGDSLTFLTPISDGGAGRNVDVVGPGTVNYRANVSNAYTGTTTVQNGTLVLNQTAGTTAILGPLVIGDITGAAGSAVVTYPGTPGGADEMIANAVPVTINPDGQLNLAGHVETIGTLTITNGSATTGPGGRLSVTGLTMTGGSITLGTPGFPGQLVLNGNVTTSTAGSTAPRINGPGTISLAGSDRTFAVNDGTPTDDLVISAALATAGGGRLIKTGPGRLTFESVGASNVPVRVQTGDVQVGDFTVPAANIGPVQLAGGSLSGTGTVDALTDAAGGTVSPGVGGPGILRSGAITWAATTTFNVNVAAANRPPVAGTDYDQLQATGDVFLNGATLTGSLGAGVVVGDRFVILTTTGGTIQGTFAEPLGPGKVFIGGQKFDVDYSNPNQVSLVRALANATVSLASSANPATNNQPVVITATVVPETGVAVPTSGSVTFTVQRTAPTAATFQISKTVNASGQAFLLSSDFPAGFFSGLPSTGTFTVSAKYGDGSVAFNDTPDATLTPDEVVEVPVIGGLTVTVPPGGATPLIISPQNPTSTGVQDIAIVTATVGQERAATPTPPTWAVTISNGVNTRVITGTAVIAGNSFPISATWNGRDNANAVVPDGSYNVTAAFSDQYGNTGSTTIANALVVDNTSPQLSGLTNSQPVIAPGTNSTVPTSTTIATTITEPHLSGWTLTVKKGNGPAVATQTGTGAAVNFTWYGTLNNVPGAAALTDGDYTATLVVTDTAGNSTTASTTVTVLTQAPTVTLRSNSPTLYGEGITLTATISAASALSNLLVGNSIDFYQAGNPTPVRTGTITQVAGRYQATVTLTSPVYTATGSPYQFTAAYAGSTNFLPSTSTPINHTVNPVQLTVFADDLSKVYGDAIPAPTFSTDGLQFADTPASVLTGSLSVSPAVSQSSPVGVYQNVINQGTLALANPNYTLAFVDGSLTVTPATLTVKANPITKGYGQPVPQLTYTATGFVLGESQSVLTGSLGLATPVTAA
ncbi:MAG: hypothetical protein K2P78_02825, partial [Gemmataceae bacterium]|nr:hypothetical protein [Gemmataceae bacterium]